MGVFYWERHRRGRSFGPRRRGGLPADTPQLDGATPLYVAAPRKSETRSPGDIAAKSRSSQDVEVPPSKCAIPCGGCCGSPLGRGGPGGPSPSPARAPPRQRANFLAIVEKALAKIRMFFPHPEILQHQLEKQHRIAYYVVTGQGLTNINMSRIRPGARRERLHAEA